VAPALFLFLFAPVSAEYLIGCDDTIGDPAVLVFGAIPYWDDMREPPSSRPSA
jgi:hypothetical protein